MGTQEDKREARSKLMWQLQLLGALLCPLGLLLCPLGAGKETHRARKTIQWAKTKTQGAQKGTLVALLMTEASSEIQQVVYVEHCVGLLNTKLEVLMSVSHDKVPSGQIYTLSTHCSAYTHKSDTTYMVYYDTFWQDHVHPKTVKVSRHMLAGRVDVTGDGCTVNVGYKNAGYNDNRDITTKQAGTGFTALKPHRV